MSKPKVLLLGQIEHANETWNQLNDLADLIEPESDNRENFIKECKDGKLDGVVAVYRTFFSIETTGLWDEELIKVLPDSLKVVAHNGAGYDQITVAPLTERKILITNTPTAVDDATADTSLFLILGALRNFNTSILALRNGNWRGNPPPPLGHDPQGKLVGILGMGGIGRNLARKCRAFGMRIQYHNRRRLSDADADGATFVSFEELLATSDVISVHVPLSDATKHLISTKEFGMMKEGVFVVNTARGAVIDEAAMVEALKEGRVASVGLDVYEEEPKVHEGLVNDDRVLLLPHMGTWTVETATKMEQWTIGNVRCALEWLNGDKKKAKDMSVVPDQKDLFKELVG